MEENQRKCEDCGKYILPMCNSMYDNKWRCLKCNINFSRQCVKEGTNQQ